MSTMVYKHMMQLWILLSPKACAPVTLLCGPVLRFPDTLLCVPCSQVPRAGVTPCAHRGLTSVSNSLGSELTHLHLTECATHSFALSLIVQY